MPEKAAYLEIEENADVEFEFFLAEKLRMTVARLHEEMSHEEFVRWNVYYARKAQLEELAAQKAKGG